jgi:hypothetical protein
MSQVSRVNAALFEGILTGGKYFTLAKLLGTTVFMLNPIQD